MNLFGKHYRASNQYRYIDSPLKKVIKTTLGVSFGLAVSYYSLKHGLPNALEHFSHGVDYKDALSPDANERVNIFFSTLAATPIVSAAAMISSGLIYHAITSKPVSSKQCVMALIATPLAMSAFSLHFDPTWSDTLINSFNIVKDFGLGTAIGVGSLVGLITPLLGDKIANSVENLLKKSPKFNDLVKQHYDKLEKKQEQHEIKKQVNYLSQANQEFNLYQSYQSIRKTLEHCFNDNHLNDLQMFYSLNNFYNKGKYILEEGSLENQFEVKKSFRHLAHWVVEYEKGLHRLDRDVQLEKTQHLDASFLSMDKDFDKLVESAKNHEQMNTSMDYDEALTHIQEQFSHSKKLTHF